MTNSHASGVQISTNFDLATDEKEDLTKVVFVGQFRRGRFDQPFKVTKATLNSLLGRDSKNHFYTALQDAFKAGAGELWVMRIAPDEIHVDDPLYSDWIVLTSIASANGTARYTAYKTNTLDYYDSFADIDLTKAIVRSLHNADMQSWQAVKDACFSLSGTSGWTWDLSNQLIKYKDGTDLNILPQAWCASLDVGKYYCSHTYQDLEDKLMTVNGGVIYSDMYFCEKNWIGDAYYYLYRNNPSCQYYHQGTQVTFRYIDNPFYNPTATGAELSVSFAKIAEKILLNASDSSDSISLMAQVYLETVANSILTPDESKQFVKLSDISSQLESNKTLRSE